MDGYSLVPLRFVSEALGCDVVWDGEHRTVRITSAFTYETTVAWGVNLRSAPDTDSETVGEELLPAGSKLHVVREAGALWLEVRTADGRSGYVSAKPKYTDYRSDALADKQADELIAYGKTFEGTPYEFGASPDQTKTFDCSSFVKRVYADILSIELPRVSYDQAKEGTEVGLDELRKGICCSSAHAGWISATSGSISTTIKFCTPTPKSREFISRRSMASGKSGSSPRGGCFEVAAGVNAEISRG
ncbi:hypothetical protein HMSSN139_43030 [Paenibacillus sp. HMSSN-139]|nr:hypothetical protein HMSSN139_43030 [Paenibacillus sp. HMSSN-139]